ncbi:MAG: hypothetical protein V1918_07460, partial [Planctomycetota bacterium]
LAPESLRFETTAHALAMAGAGVYWPGRQAGFLFAAEPETFLGVTGLGFRYDRERGQGIFFLSLPAWKDREPTYLGEAGGVALSFCLSLFDCASCRDFFRGVNHLRLLLHPEESPRPVLPFSHAAALIEESLNTHHWLDPYYLSAIGLENLRQGPRPATDAFPQEWYLQEGKSGGSALAYALTRSPSEATRNRGWGMLEFIARQGVSPSGLFFSLVGRWGPLYGAPWTHVRPALDACFYMLRAAGERGEEEGEILRRAAGQSLDALVEIFRRHGEFGRAVSREKGAELLEPGTAAGGLAIACLVLGHRLFRRKTYLETAKEAARVYAGILSRGSAGGCDPLAGPALPDSASLTALLESFMSLYEETQEDACLEGALAAAEAFASYVMARSIALPPDSDLARAGIATRGAVLTGGGAARLGPGPWSTSLGALLRLYRVTGEEWLLSLLSDVALALPQYVATFHARVGDLRRGMAASEIPLLPEGTRLPYSVEPVSRLGTAQAILLMRAELPGVYVDPPREALAVFDHVNASVDFEAMRLYLSNPTPYRAQGRIEVEVGTRLAYDLAPGESADWPF